MSRNATPGRNVLGTVAHFRPSLSSTNPAGRIIANTTPPEIENRKPISVGVSPSSASAYSGSTLCSVMRNVNPANVARTNTQ